MANRREFTESVKREIKDRAGGKCENYRMGPDIALLFPRNCPNQPSDIDHIYADVLDDEKSEPLTANDGAYLCKQCHAIKTRTDQKYRAKRNKHTVRKDRPKSGWFRSGQKMQGRGFSKTHKRTIASKNKPSRTVRRDD